MVYLDPKSHRPTNDRSTQCSVRFHGRERPEPENLKNDRSFAWKGTKSDSREQKTTQISITENISTGKMTDFIQETRDNRDMCVQFLSTSVLNGTALRIIASLRAHTKRIFRTAKYPRFRLPGSQMIITHFPSRPYVIVFNLTPSLSTARANNILR